MRGDALKRLESKIDEPELQRGASLSKAGGPRGTILCFFPYRMRLFLNPCFLDACLTSPPMSYEFCVWTVESNRNGIHGSQILVTCWAELGSIVSSYQIHGGACCVPHNTLPQDPSFVNRHSEPPMRP